MKLNLRDVIEAIEFGNESLNHYYNKKSGVIIYKEDESTAGYSACQIDDIEGLEEWEAEFVKSLHDLKSNPGDYIKLPSRSDDDEYEMMKEFYDNFTDLPLEGHDIGELKRLIQDMGLINDWYDYREEAEYDIAVKWCSDNGIEFEE